MPSEGLFFREGEECPSISDSGSFLPHVKPKLLLGRSSKSEEVVGTGRPQSEVWWWAPGLIILTVLYTFKVSSVSVSEMENDDHLIDNT